MKYKPKYLRLNMGYSREDLCEMFEGLGVEMTTRMLSDRENEITQWKGTEVVALIKIFKVDADQLDISY